MIFKMTFNEALVIQRAQMVYYRNAIGRKAIKKIIKRTIYPTDINPNKMMDVCEINKLVPRGADFEKYIKPRRRYYHDPTSVDYHNAIRRGLL